MPIDVYVTDIESVDENLRGFYKENNEGEGYILDANPINGYAVENVENLKSALGKERTERKSFEKKYNKLSEQFKDVDLEELQSDLSSYKEKYEKLSTIDPESEAAKLAEEKIKAAEEKISKKLEQKQKEWQKLHDTEVGSREDKIKNLTSQLKNLMVDNVATNALVEAGIVQEHLELILPKVTGAMRLVESENGELTPEIIDAEGSARVRSDGQNMTVKDLIPELQDRWPSSFATDSKGGGGMEGSRQNAGKRSSGEKSSLDKISQGLQNLK